VNLIFTFFGGQIERGMAKGLTKVAPVLKRFVMFTAALATGTYRAVRNVRATDAHHIIQHAAVKNVPGYRRGAAPAIQLPGPSTKVGSPHYKATQVQRRAGGGTYGAERRIGYKALRKAGLTPAESRAEIKRADDYFMGVLGLTHSSPTRAVGNRW
jgi:hypothetical protein